MTRAEVLDALTERIAHALRKEIWLATGDEDLADQIPAEDMADALLRDVVLSARDDEPCPTCHPHGDVELKDEDGKTYLAPCPDCTDGTRPGPLLVTLAAMRHATPDETYGMTWVEREEET